MINKKIYTLTSINDKKGQSKSIHWPLLMIKKVNKKYTLTCINIKKNIHWPVLILKKVYIDLY